MATLWVQAQELGTAREPAVKAAYLLNFTAFVEWPPAALDAQDAFVIGVYGDDAVAAELETLVVGRRVRGLPVVVRRAREVPTGERVHLAYLAARRESRVSEMTARLAGPVLVVTHLNDGLAAGAVLNFVLDNGRLRFEASQRRAEQRDLRLSSRLLALAVTVEGRP
nr:YfiR family protein [Ramlibacter aurantiacus]